MPLAKKVWGAFPEIDTFAIESFVCPLLLDNCLPHHANGLDPCLWYTDVGVQVNKNLTSL